MLEQLQDEKDRIRRAVLARRRSLPPAHGLMAARSAAANLMGLPEVRRAQNVMVYLTYKSELSTEFVIHALRAAGKTLYAPRIDQDTSLLLPAYLPPEAELRPGPYDVPEPVGTECVDPRRLDAVIVPGVAFDLSGRRLGFGKGYYDRFLAALGGSAVKVGLAYDLQLVPEVPAGPDDVPVDIVVTESRVVRVVVPHGL